MTRVSLIGDVHGDVARLTAMLDIVEAETDRMVVLLGDYVNWGPDPAGVLELLSRRQVRLGDRLVLLEGNHDRAFREFLDGGDIALLLAMGGAATVRSYIGAARGELSGRPPRPCSAEPHQVSSCSSRCGAPTISSLFTNGRITISRSARGTLSSAITRSSITDRASRNTLPTWTQDAAPTRMVSDPPQIPRR